MPDRRRYERSCRSSHDSKSLEDKCIGCNKVGHFFRNCPHVRCYCCNGKRHTSMDCPMFSSKRRGTQLGLNIVRVRAMLVIVGVKVLVKQ